MAQGFGKQLDWQNVSAIEVSPLADNEVHIWWVPMDIGKKLQHQFLPLLSDAQKTKLERLPTDKLKTRYIAGRGYLASLVAAYIDIKPAEVKFQFGKLGKPFLHKALGELHFNFSDTSSPNLGGMGLFGFSKRHELGVDLEWAGRTGRFQQIMKRRFSESEQHLLNSQSEAEQSAHFLSCWTRKEAYGKALGLGIRYPMREIDLCNDCKDPILQLSETDWTIQQLALPDNFIGCLVNQGVKALPAKAYHLISGNG